MLNSENGIIFSAFFSKLAAEWVISHKPKNLTIVIRGRLSDFIAGAANIEAIQVLLSAGQRVFFNFDLHAKIFHFGDEILLGSSNLTSNGLNLLNNGGNIELSSVISATEINVSVLKRIISTSIEINLEKLQQLILFMDQNDLKSKVEIGTWPKGIFSENKQLSIWCSELPAYDFKISILEDYYVWGDIARLSENDKSKEASALLQNTAAYQWLAKFIALSKNNRESFGAVSAALHQSLSDDPSPLRKNVKLFQQNLYTFIKKIDTELEIFQPNISQIIRMKDKT